MIASIIAIAIANKMQFVLFILCYFYLFYSFYLYILFYIFYLSFHLTLFAIANARQHKSCEAADGLRKIRLGGLGVCRD